MRIILLLIAVMLLMTVADARYSPGLEIAEGENITLDKITFRNSVPSVTTNALYSVSGALTWNGTAIDLSGAVGNYDYLVYQDGSSIYAVSRNGTLIDSGTYNTNDAEVTQAAVNESNTGLVYMAAGSYIWENTVYISNKENFTFQGAGKATYITAAASLNKDMFYSEHCNFLNIESMFLDGNNEATTSGNGIHLGHFQSVPKIEDLQIRRCSENAIYANGTLGNMVVMPQIINCQGLSENNASGIYFGSMAYDGQISGCDIGFNNENGITIAGPGYHEINDNKIWGNNIGQTANTYAGIVLSSVTSGVISNNRIDFNHRHGILAMVSYNLVITGNNVYQNNMANQATGTGVYLNACHDCTVTGNNLCGPIDAYSELQKYGIVEDGASDYNAIVGNNLHGCASDGTTVGAHDVIANNVAA